MISLQYSPEALSDVAATRDWYDNQRWGLGDEFLDAVDAAIEAAENNPQAHQCIEGSVRRVLLRRFPYAMFYDADRAVILAVLHVRQHPPSWSNDP